MATEPIKAVVDTTNKHLAQQASSLMSAALESVRYFYNQGVKVGTVTGASRAGVKATSQSHGFEK